MKNLKGVMTALITPFKENKIDYASLEKLVEFQISKGVSGFVINGTTGESPTVSSAERKEIFKFVQSRVPTTVPLILGTGTNSTEESIQNSILAEKMGADAVLTVVPYYNKPPQRGLVEHFNKIATQIGIPVILYNVPSRTITALELDAIKRLCEHPNIIGIKEASGDIEFAKKIRASCGSQFLLLSGDDATYEEFMQAGGDGIISVAAHVIPKIIIDKDTKRNKDLIESFYIESNPIPIKMALYLMKIIDSAELRLPLIKMDEKKAMLLKEILKNKGILE